MRVGQTPYGVSGMGDSAVREADVHQAFKYGFIPIVVGFRTTHLRDRMTLRMV